MKSSKLLKFIFLLFITAGFINGMYAQDGHNKKKIKISGTAKTQSVNCNGETVYISGNRHKITVTGYCFQIVVYGDERCH